MTSITDTDDNSRVYRKHNANLYAPYLWCKQIKTDKLVTTTDITTFSGEKLTYATSHTFTDDDISWLAYDNTAKQWTGNFIVFIENTTSQKIGTMYLVLNKAIGGTSIDIKLWQNLSSFTAVSVSSSSINSFTISTGTDQSHLRWRLEGSIFE